MYHAILSEHVCATIYNKLLPNIPDKGATMDLSFNLDFEVTLLWSFKLQGKEGRDHKGL